MAFADPVTLANDNTSPNNERIFDFIGSPGYKQSEYTLQGAPDATKACTMKISHQTVGQGTSIRDRHLLRFEAPSIDADDVIGLTASAVCYVVFDIPRNNVADSIAYTLARQLVGFLRDQYVTSDTPDYTTNFAKLLSGQS